MEISKLIRFSSLNLNFKSIFFFFLENLSSPHSFLVEKLNSGKLLTEKRIDFEYPEREKTVSPSHGSIYEKEEVLESKKNNHRKVIRPEYTIEYAYRETRNEIMNNDDESGKGGCG